jgi:hypothetical protein
VDDREVNNIYAIPANYTDSGKLLGGMLETRNTIEAIILILIVGYPELMWMPAPGTIKVVVMTVTLLPLGVLALMGIAGDSLTQYFGHITRHWARRRKLHFRRVGYRYEKEIVKGTKRAGREKRAQKRKTKAETENEMPPEAEAEE